MVELLPLKVYPLNLMCWDTASNHLWEIVDGVKEITKEFCATIISNVKTGLYIMVVT